MSKTLNEIRSAFLGEELSEENVEELADSLKYSLTFDTIYGMGDQAILEYLDKDENHYGEIQPEPGREKELNRIEKEAEKRKKYFEDNRNRGIFAAAGGEVKGPGTGTSDSVPARLSDGEFVLTAKAVRGAGGGDRNIGAARMYDMMSQLEGAA